MTEPQGLTDWQKLGTVTTANGMFAIVAPYYANTLGKYWDEQYLPDLRAQTEGRNPRRPLRLFEEIELRQITTSVTWPDGYEDRETAFLLACDNGGYDVEGRFCDLYGDGHMSLCELRIRLHWADHDDDVDRVHPEVRASAWRSLMGETDGTEGEQ